MNIIKRIWTDIKSFVSSEGDQNPDHANGAGEHLQCSDRIGNEENFAFLPEASTDSGVRDGKDHTAPLVAEGDSLSHLPSETVQKDIGTSSVHRANARMYVAMQHAVLNGYVNVIERLLREGHSPDAMDRYGDTALMLAARTGSAKICSILLEAGADRDLKDARGRTALMIAEELHHADVVRILNPVSETFDYGLDVAQDNEKSVQKDTEPLNAHIKSFVSSEGEQDPDHANGAGEHLQCSDRKGKEEDFEILPEASADSGVRDGKDHTAPLAAESDSFSHLPSETVQKDIGTSSVHSANARMHVAMQHAVQNGYVNVIERLLREGHSPDAMDRYGDTALMLAARTGSAQICSMLLEAGADRDLKDARGRTALMIAEELHHADVVRILNPVSETFDYGLGVAQDNEKSVQKDTEPSNAHHANARMNRLMQLAIEKRQTYVVTTLLSKGEKTDALDEHGNSALMLAARAGSAEICSILLEAGADRDLRDSKGRTALMIAEEFGHAEVARILNHFSETLDGGSTGAPEGTEEDSGDVPPNASGMQKGDKVCEHPAQKEARAAGDRHVNEKMPLLMKFAIEKGNQQAVEILLKRGESPDALDRYGNTALMLAARNGSAEICALLLEAGADRELRDSKGRTALMIAEELNHSDVARILKSISEDSENEISGGDDSFWIGDWEEKQPQAMPQEQDANVIKRARQFISDIAEFDPKDNGEKWDIDQSIDPWDEWNIPDDSFKSPSAGDAEKDSMDLPSKASDMQRIGRGREEPAQEETRTSNVRHVHASMCKAMQFAIQKGHAHVVEILLSAGQSPDALDKYGNTALMLAAKEGAAQICGILLCAGANRDLRDARGRTARMIAEEFNHSDVIRIMDYFSYSYDNDDRGRARGG